MSWVGPVVEGESEGRAVPKLLEKLGVRARAPVIAEGKADLFERAVQYAEAQRLQGATLVLFCFDADEASPEDERRRLGERVGEIPHACFIAVKMLES